MLAISPGVSGLGSDKSDADPEDKVKALVETALIGMGAVLVTKSWVPLVLPFGYLIGSYLWDQSRIPHHINNAAAAADYETGEYQTWP